MLKFIMKTAVNAARSFRVWINHHSEALNLLFTQVFLLNLSDIITEIDDFSKVSAFMKSMKYECKFLWGSLLLHVSLAVW